MSVREKILKDVNEIENPNMLNEIYDFIQQLNVSSKTNEEENKTAVMELRGCLSDADANEMISIISNEFSNIEGDWK